MNKRHTVPYDQALKGFSPTSRPIQRVCHSCVCGCPLQSTTRTSRHCSTAGAEHRPAQAGQALVLGAGAWRHAGYRMGLITPRARGFRSVGSSTCSTASDRKPGPSTWASTRHPAPLGDHTHTCCHLSSREGWALDHPPAVSQGKETSRGYSGTQGTSATREGAAESGSRLLEHRPPPCTAHSRQATRPRHRAPHRALASLRGLSRTVTVSPALT